MNGQMKPRGGKHPGETPKPKSSGGSGGKSPKRQMGNVPGHGKSKERMC